MKEYVWLFPIIFMFHDMEEIIGFKFFSATKRGRTPAAFPFYPPPLQELFYRRLCPCCLRRTNLVYCNFCAGIFYRPEFFVVYLAGSFSWLRPSLFHSSDSGKHLPPLYSGLHNKFDLPSGKYLDYLQMSFVH